jgi:hypothetical protein
MAHTRPPPVVARVAKQHLLLRLLKRFTSMQAEVLVSMVGAPLAAEPRAVGVRRIFGVVEPHILTVLPLLAVLAALGRMARTTVGVAG